jgi:hypothetical protein
MRNRGGVCIEQAQAYNEKPACERATGKTKNHWHKDAGNGICQALSRSFAVLSLFNEMDNLSQSSCFPYLMKRFVCDASIPSKAPYQSGLFQSVFFLIFFALPFLIRLNCSSETLILLCCLL